MSRSRLIPHRFRHEVLHETRRALRLDGEIRMRGSEVSVRGRPCATCPYRRDVPSGIWAEEEYHKLRDYDGDTTDQAISGAFAAFFCHTRDGYLCAGWVGCHDMAENLAIRVRNDLDLNTIFAYQSPVPLFGSGAEAAEHGLRDIAHPGLAARRKIAQLLRRQDHS